jgi:hypothetical protein
MGYFLIQIVIQAKKCHNQQNVKITYPDFVYINPKSSEQ